MFRTAIAASAMAAALASFVYPEPARAQYAPQARIWVDGDRDYFSRGDRLNVRFSSSRDAYVAVVHIDTDGTLDFLYPRNPWDDGYVQGGRVNSLHQGRYSIRGRSGMGYLYVIASDEPLDFSYFGGPHRGSWDWSFAGRHVTGDPYVALEQITRYLVPNYGYGGYSVDYYSYHVDRRYRYPSYACGVNRWGTHRGWGWTRHYGSCDRVVIFLRSHPYYYDTHRYRGDRLVYLRGDRLPEVRHGYKAPAREGAGGRLDTPARRATGARGSATGRTSTPVQPERQRPTLERRGPDEQARPSTRSTPTRGTRGTSTARPSSRSGGSGGVQRAEPSPSSTRQGGGQPASRPAARPTSRGGGGGSAAPARSSGGSRGGSARPAPRSSGGSGGGSARPAQSSGRSGGGRSGGEAPATRSRSRGGGGGDNIALNTASPRLSVDPSPAAA